MLQHHRQGFDPPAFPLRGVQLRGRQHPDRPRGSGPNPEGPGCLHSPAILHSQIHQVRRGEGRRGPGRQDRPGGVPKKKPLRTHPGGPVRRSRPILVLPGKQRPLDNRQARSGRNDQHGLPRAPLPQVLTARPGESIRPTPETFDAPTPCPRWRVELPDWTCRFVSNRGNTCGKTTAQDSDRCERHQRLCWPPPPQPRRL